MFKMRVRHGQKLIRKESARDRDTSMHRLIWSAVRNWVPMPESAFAPSARASGALVKATPSPKTLIRTPVVLPAAKFPPVPDSNHAEFLLLRDSDQVLDKGQAGTRLH